MFSACYKWLSYPSPNRFGCSARKYSGARINYWYVLVQDYKIKTSSQIRFMSQKKNTSVCLKVAVDLHYTVIYYIL